MKPCTFENGKTIVESETGAHIATVHNFNPNYLENGKLLASAPELLDACKFAYDVAVFEGLPEHVANVLQKAIEKAEGKS